MSLLGKWFGFGKDEILDEAAVLVQSGDIEGAIEALEGLLDHKPEADIERSARGLLGKAYVQLAQLHLKLGDPKAAIRAFDAALEYVPAYPDLMLQEARAYGELGDSQGERQCVASALKQNPNFAVAHAYSAWLAYRAGRDDIALEELDRAAQLDREFADSRLKAFWQEHRSGDREAASRLLADFSKDNRTDAELLAKLAEAQMRESDWTEAVVSLERALRQAPGYADLWERYGECLLQLDRLSDAEHAFRHALAANPRYADAWAGLGICLVRLARSGEAVAAFEHAYESDPNHPVAAMELKRLAG